MGMLIYLMASYHILQWRSLPTNKRYHYECHGTSMNARIMATHNMTNKELSAAMFDFNYAVSGGLWHGDSFKALAIKIFRVYSSSLHNHGNVNSIVQSLCLFIDECFSHSIVCC